MVEISTSILSIDKKEAVKTLYNLEAANTDYFHIDVMDGKFVENNTNDTMLEYCEYLNSITNVPLDVHLMVEDVQEYIKSYLVFEPNTITFHLEAAKSAGELKSLVEYIKENNCKVGISIRPNTPVEKLYEILPYIHTVLIMTVEPGKGGQKLIPETIEKIRKIKKHIEEKGLETDIEADGGVNLDNVKELTEAGCNIIVAGTVVTSSDNYKETIQKLKNAL